MDLPRDRPPNAEGVASPIEMDGVEVSGGADGVLFAAPNGPLEDEAKALKPPPVEEPNALVVAEPPNAEVLLEEPNGEGEDCAPKEPCPKVGCCPNVDVWPKGDVVDGCPKAEGCPKDVVGWAKADADCWPNTGADCCCWPEPPVACCPNEEALGEGCITPASPGYGFESG